MVAPADGIAEGVHDASVGGGSRPKLIVIKVAAIGFEHVGVTFCVKRLCFIPSRAGKEGGEVFSVNTTFR